MGGPIQVPSAFMLTDVFMYAHEHCLKKKLFKSDGECVAELAAQEGVVLKKLIGSLRALWRSSSQGGHDTRMADLKTYLLPSPTRSAHTPVQAPGPESGNEDAESEGEGSEGEDSKSEEGPAEEPVAISQESSGDDGNSDDDEVSEEESSHGTLSAPTLTLPGKSPSDHGVDTTQSDCSSEVSSPTTEGNNDSQVSSGWLGKAYMHGNQEKRREEEKQRVLEEEKHKWAAFEFLVKEIKNDLEEALETKLEGVLWDGYASFAFNAFADYGEHVYSHLASVDTYQDWVREQKAQDRWKTVQSPTILLCKLPQLILFCKIFCTHIHLSIALSCNWYCLASFSVPISTCQVLTTDCFASCSVPISTCQ